MIQHDSIGYIRNGDGREPLGVWCESESEAHRFIVCYGPCVVRDPETIKVEVGDLDVTVRVKLLEIADKCRALAAELIEHADRLESRAAEEVVIEAAKENVIAESEDAGTELLAEPPAAADTEHLTPTPALGKPVRDMLPLQLPEQETRKSVKPERNDS